MKRLIIVIISLLLVFSCVSVFSVCAAEEDDFYTEMSAEIDDILSDYGIGIEAEDMESLSLSSLWDRLWAAVSARLSAPMRLLSGILLVILFGTVAKSAIETTDEIYNMVCVISSSVVIIPQIIGVYEDILGTIQRTGGFILVFVPVMSAVSVACGGFTTAGVCHMLLLGASEVIVRLSESYLLPILSVTASLGITGSVFPSTSLDSLVNLVKKTLTWIISVTMTLFSGFVALKCTITGRADGAAAKTAKMLVSGIIPIVGGAVSDAYSTVKGSFEVIGGTIGGAGIIAIIMLLLPSILELMVYRFVMWTGSAAADVFSSDAMSKLLKSIDSGFAIAQCVLVCYSIIFILCSAILMKTFGG